MAASRSRRGGQVDRPVVHGGQEIAADGGALRIEPQGHGVDGCRGGETMIAQQMDRPVVIDHRHQLRSRTSHGTALFFAGRATPGRDFGSFCAAGLIEQRGPVISTSKDTSSIARGSSRGRDSPLRNGQQFGRQHMEERRGAHAVETAVTRRLPQIGAGQVIAALQDTPVQESPNRLGPFRGVPSTDPQTRCSFTRAARC